MRHGCRQGLRTAALAVLVLACLATVGIGAQWKRLAEDGVHDPQSPAIGQLQEPAEALRVLPPDSAGNMVQWVHAIERGAIAPRTSLQQTTPVRIREDAIIISKYGSMPAVEFPHRQHTLWLDCTNCHEHLFVSRAGANRFSMERILNGEQCGVCHGAVSFPLTECQRCHNTSNDALFRREIEARRAAQRQ